MKFVQTLLIVPPNDAEAILIRDIAQAFGIPTMCSKQTHGASIDKGRDYVSDIREGKYRRVIVVEMPGPKTETRIKKMGVELVIIDHHHYTGLDRAHDPHTGRLLPSSLEQFLRLFRISNSQLRSHGFDPFLVQGIGIMDRGFVWALQDEGLSKAHLQKVLDYHDVLLSPIRHPKTEKRKQRIAKQAWSRRERWNGYFIVRTRANMQLRPRLSRIVATQRGKPTPLIILEYSRKLLYVQESDRAMDLFFAFGGFTFGGDRNWGYRNEPGKKFITLRQIKNILN